MLALTLALAAGAAEAAKPIIVGFYVPWDPASRAAAVAHAGQVDILAPMTGALDSPAGTVRWQPDPVPAALPKSAKGRPAPKLFPIVSNAHDTVWDAAAADGALPRSRRGATSSSPPSPPRPRRAATAATSSTSRP